MRHLLAIALLGFSFSVIAEAQRPSGPPPEALAACSGKTQGAACSFKTPRGDQMNGTCALPPAPGGRGEAGATPALSCRPANPSPRPD